MKRIVVAVILMLLTACGRHHSDGKPQPEKKITQGLYTKLGTDMNVLVVLYDNQTYQSFIVSDKEKSFSRTAGQFRYESGTIKFNPLVTSCAEMMPILNGIIIENQEILTKKQKAEKFSVEPNEVTKILNGIASKKEVCSEYLDVAKAEFLELSIELKNNPKLVAEVMKGSEPSKLPPPPPTTPEASGSGKSL